MTDTTAEQTPLAPEEFDAYIEKYPFAAEPSYFTRANRYSGPASTWRSWTSHERNIAESLDLAESQNLSLHLYNAFLLNKPTRANHRSTRRSDTALDRTWTAWPIAYKHIPPCDNPGPALQEALVSSTLRFAKAQWAARPVEEVAEDLDAGKATTPEDEREDKDEPTPVPEGVQTFSSQAWVDSESDEEPEEEDPPVLSADDDRARLLLGPTTRHILSQLDSLLMALHTTRNAYAATRDQSRSRSRSAADSPCIRSGSRAEARKELRRSESASSKPGRSRSSRSREKRPLKPRDWSDVLGVAAMTGWDAEVVRRAGERCAALFEEDMLFRTFPDGDAQGFSESRASGLETSVPSDGSYRETTRESLPASTTSLVVSSELSCPVPSCPKAGRQYGRAARLYQHISRQHPEFNLDLFIEMRLRGKGTLGQYRGRSKSRRATPQPSGEETTR